MKITVRGESHGRPFALVAGGVRLAVRLTPRAGANGLVGVIVGSDGRPALHLRLAAAPVDNAANTALIGYVAAALGLRRRDVRIQSGATGRLKLLHLAGDSAAIEARLTGWIEGGG